MARKQHKALAKREALQAELATTFRAKADANRGRLEATEAAKALGRDVKVALEDAARGVDGAEQRVTELRAQVADAERRAVDFDQRADGAGRAAVDVQRRLNRLLASEPEFLREAMDAANQADELAGEAWTALENWERAYRAAEKRWHPLVRAVRTTPVDGQTKNGERSNRDLGPLPRPPAFAKLRAAIVEAKPPVPAGVREPSRFASLLPGPARRWLGVDVPKTEKPDYEEAAV